MLCYGVLYAWSIFSAPFSDEFGMSSGTLGFCFTLIMIMFCLGGIAGSVITGRYGAHRSVPFGAVLCFLGYSLVFFADMTKSWLIFPLFAMSGLGCGVVYNAVLSGVVKQFPEKTGFASGMLLMGFGASTLLLGTAVSALMSSPIGWRMTYVLTGLLLLAVGITGSFFLPDEKKAPQTAKAEGDGLAPAQMLKTGSFWLYFFIAAILSGFGQGVIGHARGIFVSVGVSAASAAVFVGLISVANGLGRIAFGFLYDRKGFRLPLSVDAVLYILAGLISAWAITGGRSVIVIVMLILCGFCYGGVPPISSSVTKTFFGTRYYAGNLSLINLTIIPSSFASTLMGSMSGRSGSYLSALLVFSALELVPLALVFILYEIRKREEKVNDERI